LELLIDADSCNDMGECVRFWPDDRVTSKLLLLSSLSELDRLRERCRRLLSLADRISLGRRAKLSVRLGDDTLAEVTLSPKAKEVYEDEVRGSFFFLLVSTILSSFDVLTNRSNIGLVLLPEANDNTRRTYDQVDLLRW
jgi:hypothetical protein